VLTHLRQLIAAEQVDILRVGAKEEADMTLPAAWVFA
jgi:hypothetical protein